jgi:Recombination endonuclease VII.
MPPTNCKTCNVEFTPFNSVKNGMGGIRHECKDCHNQKKNAIRSLDKEKYSQYNWEYMLKRSFNITPEQYNEMLETQGSKCAVCNSECIRYDKLSVDHDHVTNKVRGLLCHRCNTALGLLQDNPEIISNLLEYLIRSKERIG